MEMHILVEQLVEQPAKMAAVPRQIVEPVGQVLGMERRRLEELVLMMVVRLRQIAGVAGSMRR
jgi:hypothetical protein